MFRQFNVYYKLLKWKLKLYFFYKERTALASYPRSGNTWLRVLIEKATQEKSGSIYHDRVFARGQHGIVIKSHAYDNHRYKKAILIVRNPFDVIVSLYNWHKNIAGNYDQIRDFDQFVIRTARQWRNHTLHWLILKSKNRLHIVKYEDLLQQPEIELKQIFDFLNRKVSITTIKQAIEQSKIDRLKTDKEAKNYQQFFREGKSNKGKDLLTSEQIYRVYQITGDIMEQFSYYS